MCRRRRRCKRFERGATLTAAAKTCCSQNYKPPTRRLRVACARHRAKPAADAAHAARRRVEQRADGFCQISKRFQELKMRIES